VDRLEALIDPRDRPSSSIRPGVTGTSTSWICIEKRIRTGDRRLCRHGGRVKRPATAERRTREVPGRREFTGSVRPVSSRDRVLLVFPVRPMFDVAAAQDRSCSCLNRIQVRQYTPNRAEANNWGSEL